MTTVFAGSHLRQIEDETELLKMRCRKKEKIKRFFLVCREARPRKVDGIDILPWREFLGRLWADDIVTGG